MLESLFIMLIAIAFITFLLGIDSESYPMCIISAVVWLIVFASAHYVQVPGDTSYSELTINALSLAFVFIDVILAILYYMDYTFKPSR